MNKFKIGTRLTLGFTFLLLLIALLAGVGLWRIQASDHANVELSRLQGDERLIAEWEKFIALNTTRTIAATRSTTLEAQRFFENGMAETSKRGEALQRELRERIDSDPQAVALYNTVQQRRTTYRDARAKALLAQEQGDVTAGQRFAQNEMEPLINTYLQGVSELLQYQQGRMTHTVDALAADNATARLLFIILTAAALLTGLALSVAITRSIVRPLGNAVRVAQTVASRDLTTTINAQGQDETSMLLRALQQMTHSLRGVVGDVREGAHEIATASNQILAGNQDLSSRTEEQASSLTQTASAMEELTATVRQNADNAQQANTLALSAAQVATRGGEIVADVVTTMESINDSSKKVEDIIGVIDSIAFQTNILALNAAVESARAGEAGRGFAVVAGEVRSLAQRSAQAAREIKELITASVTAAATGNRLVSQTGQTMTEIVEAIQRVTDIMGEITAASQEQSAGIEEVNQAVIQMDQTTRQNAALVEEAAAAAGSLQEQASRLATLVSTFKINDREATPQRHAKQLGKVLNTNGQSPSKEPATHLSSATAPKRAKPVEALPVPEAGHAATWPTVAAASGAGSAGAKKVAIGSFQSSAGHVEEWEEF